MNQHKAVHLRDDKGKDSGDLHGCIYFSTLELYGVVRRERCLKHKNDDGMTSCLNLAQNKGEETENFCLLRVSY